MDNGTSMKCAIYARYSSDLQRATSIEDQVRKCREYALAKGWTVDENYVRSDKGISGASLAQRDALRSLIEAAKQNPRPFARLLVDDTSRLARDVADALNMVKTLDYHGVHVLFVSQQIDSGQKSARSLLTLHGMMDEQYLVGLADKVHRGQQGRVLDGMLPGGRCFGYRNVPIEDPSRVGKYGRPAIRGVRLEIDELQAPVIRRIFRMCADGMSYAEIAKTLNSEKVLAPKPARNRRVRGWGPSSIHEMLHNERYRGVQVWNRTRKERNPETGRKISRARPQSDWMRVDVPEWRIVSEELWNETHQRLAYKKKRFANRGAAGITGRSKYLFSGLLVCGVCGAKMVIVSGDGKRAYKKYGCPSHRYRGICDNGLMIRLDRLEDQLLSYLEEHILTTEMCAYAVELFEKQLQKRLTEMEQNSETYSVRAQQLETERAKLVAQIKNITDAIKDSGHSAALLRCLSESEIALADIDEELRAYKPPSIKVAVGEFRDYATRALVNLKSLFHDTLAFPRVKLELLKHVTELVMTPAKHSEGMAYEVTGDWKILPDQKCVISLVARDGVEPPTPAFSGLRSTT